MGEVSAEGAKSAWALSRASFDRLLSVLDPDPQRAAERYEALRRKLTKLFQWRGCARPEDLADVTFDRAARRIEEGATVAPGDVSAYLHGVALHVAQEHWRQAARELVALRYYRRFLDEVDAHEEAREEAAEGAVGRTGHG